MNIYLDQPFGKVWVDDSIPSVFITFNGPMDNTQLAALVDVEQRCLKKLLKKGRDVYSLLDLRTCSPAAVDALQRYLEGTVRRQFHAGLSHKAIVSPESEVVRKKLIDTLGQFDPVAIDVHRTFAEALAAIGMKVGNKRNFPRPRRTLFAGLFWG